MNDSTLKSIVEDYVEFSNQGDLAAIARMIDANATYNSDVVGIYYGREDIMKMITDFFAAMQDHHWYVSEYETLSSNIFRFVFNFECTSVSDSKRVNRKGIETIVVNNRGLIQHVEVKKLA